MWKMSIQYTVPGLELTTFGTWVSSHNHLTRAPALIPLHYLTMISNPPTPSMSLTPVFDIALLSLFLIK